MTEMVLKKKSVLQIFKFGIVFLPLFLQVYQKVSAIVPYFCLILIRNIIIANNQTRLKIVCLFCLIKSLEFGHPVEIRPTIYDTNTNKSVFIQYLVNALYFNPKIEIISRKMY